MDRDLKATLAANVRRRRLLLGISQDELADRTRLHRTYVGGIERAERNISLASLEKLAHGLGCRPDELLREAKSSDG